MVNVFNILIIITSVLLILVVLVQNSKGGGIASNFTSNQIMDVKKSTDFIEKATWGLAIALVIFCVGSTVSIDKPTVAKNKSITEKIDEDVTGDDMGDEAPVE